MKFMEKTGKVYIPKASNTQILISYYSSLGVDYRTTFHDFLRGVSHKRYPAYSSVTRAIRLAREKHIAWEKEHTTKIDEIISVKEEIGY